MERWYSLKRITSEDFPCISAIFVKFPELKIIQDRLIVDGEIVLPPRGPSRVVLIGCLAALAA